jgi:hypothetical protein
MPQAFAIAAPEARCFEKYLQSAANVFEGFIDVIEIIGGRL